MKYTYSDMMFNPVHVNPNFYNRMQAQISQYNYQQDKNVAEAVKAMHDLCEAVKKMDESHQQQAFLGCLAEIANSFGWK